MRIRCNNLSGFAGLAAFVIAAGTPGCGSGGGEPPAPPPPPPPTTVELDVTMSVQDVAGASTETGSGTAKVTYNETDAEMAVVVTLTNVTAEAVTLNTGFAGTTGEQRFSLEPGGTADEWQLDTTPLAQSDIVDLEAGALYLEATTVENPSGALRGQILPDGIELTRIPLTPQQVTSDVDSSATGTAWATVDVVDALITVHAVTAGLDDGTGAEIRRGKAGTDGPLLAALARDMADASHWLLETTELTADMEAAADAGEVYLTFATSALPGGAIRGQWIPGDMELVVTELDTTAVVMGKHRQFAKSSAVVPVGRIMTTLESASFTSHVNLFAVGDATAVELRRAPAGQNGPVAATFEQSVDHPQRWSLEDVVIDSSLRANFDNQTLYVIVATPMEPSGVARGQLLTESSMAPVDDSAFIVESIEPPNDAEISVLPGDVVATLNRTPLPASVGPQAVRVEASGQDGSFGDGNEVDIVPASVEADGNAVTISLVGVQADDDVYRVSLLGGDDGIVDMSGIPLDGDADGEPGGTFVSAFELATPEVTATFTEIQATIFTPTCAVSGCHTGSNPPDGLNLSTGQAYSNIVNVASVQMPELLRIEPGDPANSYLLRKVEGTGIVANRMPLNGSPLSDAEIDLLRQWIVDGAENN